MKTALATVRLQGAAQQAVDVVATLETPAASVEAHVEAVQANPAKALLAVTTVAVLQPSAQLRLAVVVPLVVAVVVSVAIKVILAAVMISSPATFATTLVAMSLALALTTKANATAPVASLTHCAPA